MVNQKDPNLYPKIRAYGCGILSTCFLVHTGWTWHAVNQLYRIALDKGAIDEDCFITWEPFLDVLEAPFTFVGAKDADYKCKDDELEILQFQHGIYKHFVAGDGFGNVAFDPLINSNTVRYGKMISKRIFKKKVTA